MSLGPILKRDVEWIEIDPVITERKGRLLPEILSDQTSVVTRELEQAGVPYELLGGIMRISAGQRHDDWLVHRLSRAIYHLSDHRKNLGRGAFERKRPSKNSKK
jgi:hypothetical protein